jgi:hypothetical protein
MYIIWLEKKIKKKWRNKKKVNKIIIKWKIYLFKIYHHVYDIIIIFLFFLFTSVFLGFFLEFLCFFYYSISLYYIHKYHGICHYFRKIRGGRRYKANKNLKK